MKKKTINVYLLLSGLNNFGMSFIAATYATFLIGRGLNLLEINLVNLAFFTTLFIFEIPTGALADVFGRKRSFVISCFLWSASFGFYAAAENFPNFVMAEVIGAIGMTFATGAFQAWLKDKLEFHGLNGSIGAILAKEQIIGRLIGIAGAIIGAWLASRYDYGPWLAGGATMAIAGILAIFLMKEEYFVPKKFSFREGWQETKTVVRQSFDYARKNHSVRFILSASILILAAVQAPNMQWQPFFSNFLADKKILGFIFASISLAIAAGSWLAPHLLRKWPNEKLMIIAMQIAAGAGIVMAAGANSLSIGLSAFLFHEIGRGALKPIADAYMNDNIPSKERATLLSFQGMACHLGGMIGLAISGWLAENFGIPMTWIISGAVLVFGSMLLIKNGFAPASRRTAD